MIAVEERIVELREVAKGEGLTLQEESLRQLRVLAEFPGLLDDAFISVIYDGQIQVEWGNPKTAGMEIELRGWNGNRSDVRAIIWKEEVPA